MRVGLTRGEIRVTAYPLPMDWPSATRIRRCCALAALLLLFLLPDGAAAAQAAVALEPVQQPEAVLAVAVAVSATVLLGVRLWRDRR
jgi:hypothetical protein